MKDGSAGGRIGFEVDGTTLTVHDAIEGNRMQLRVDRQPDLSTALLELFPFPVDRAVSFEAASLSVAEYSVVNVRDGDGEFVAQPTEPIELPRSSYYIEVTGVTKAFIRVEDAEVSVRGVVGAKPIEFTFDRPTTVSVGGRSLHTRPEATITVPDDPEALAEAVSVLGSSIREFSPERSWPTLRGYPPRIRRGETLDIPAPLIVPDTGIEVVVRPTYADVFRLSTFTYYLGAQMTIGETPALRLANGYTERLPTDGHQLERRAEELLRTWFFLDTLVRTDGYVVSDRAEYGQVGPLLPFYPPNLADLSMTERLMEYLEVDPGTVASHTPSWATEAVLRPTPAAAELLPHLAHVLAPIRVRGSADHPQSDTSIALTTSDRSTGRVNPPRLECGSTPDPDAKPIPADMSAVLSAAYEHEFQRTSPDHGAASVAFLVRSDERERRLRDALTEPSVPDGVGSLSITGAPAAGAVADAFSDPSIDLLYCDLPIEDGAPIAAGDPVDISDFSESDEPKAPTVSVFEGSRDVTLGVDVANRGGTGSAMLDGQLPEDRIRTIVELLVSEGIPLDTCLAVTPLPDGLSVRFAGNASTNVVPPNPPSPRLVFVESVAESEHRITWRTVFCPRSWIGAEYQTVLDSFDDKSRLLGHDPTDEPVISSEKVAASSKELDAVLFLNDEFIPRTRDLTAEDVEASARRALSGDEPPKRGSREPVEQDSESRSRD